MAYRAEGDARPQIGQARGPIESCMLTRAYKHITITLIEYKRIVIDEQSDAKQVTDSTQTK
jgi:hypothetical protein